MKLFVAALAFALVAGISAWPQDLPKTAEELVEKVNENLKAAQDTLVAKAEEGLSKLNQVVDIPLLKNLDPNMIKNLNVSSLTPSLNKVQDVLKDKCEKNGGSYEAAKNAAGDLFNCGKNFVDLKVLQEEMEKAKPNGELDEVFAKYCKKKPEFTTCLDNFAAAVEPCLEPVEKDNKRIVQNITEKILTFVCHKEGDRIAMFVAAKGPECFKEKAGAIAECVNATLGAARDQVPFNPADGLSGLTNKLSEIKEIPTLVFDEKVCNNMQTLQTCSVRSLEKCEDPTPANLMDSIFNYIKKVTPCENLLKKN